MDMDSEVDSGLIEKLQSRGYLGLFLQLITHYFMTYNSSVFKMFRIQDDVAIEARNIPIYTKFKRV